MSKSGSTALQQGLSHLREPLRAGGYFYPEGLVTRHNQSFLVAAALPPERLPRHFLARYRGKGRRARKDFKAWISTIKAGIKEHRPQVLIMSGETLFKMSEPEQFAQLAAVLRDLASEIEVVAYLRKPSDFYMSSSQQGLKASHRIKPLVPLSYRAPLEGFAGIADRLHVIKYDRALFPGGDVLRHFIETFCEGVIPAADLPSLAANVSLSAEGLALLADYRRCFHADKANRFTKDSRLLLSAINQADRDLPGNTRPQLKPELARIMNEGSTDLLWLREAHGITFEGIDYDRIAPMGAQRRPRRVEQICVVDKRKKRKTALHVFHHLTGEVMRTRDMKAPPPFSQA
jgi:hypothetical protein